MPGRSKVNFDLQFPLLTFTAGLRLGTFQKTFYMFSGVTLLPKASISLKVWRDASTLHNRPFCTSWDDYKTQLYLYSPLDGKESHIKKFN